MRIALKERRQESDDVISFIFDLRGQPFDYRPGQFAWYELDELAFPDPRGKRRHFTLASSPTEQGIAQVTTKLCGSGFKETLRHAPIGYELMLEAPPASFVLEVGFIINRSHEDALPGNFFNLFPVRESKPIYFPSHKRFNTAGFGATHGCEFTQFDHPNSRDLHRSILRAQICNLVGIELQTKQGFNRC